MLSRRYLRQPNEQPFSLWIDSVLVGFERSKLKEHMQYCMDHPDEISKLAKVKAQVSEVKGVMMENIEKVII